MSDFVLEKSTQQLVPPKSPETATTPRLPDFMTGVTCCLTAVADDQLRRRLNRYLIAYPFVSFCFGSRSTLCTIIDLFVAIAALATIKNSLQL